MFVFSDIPFSILRDVSGDVLNWLNRQEAQTLSENDKRSTRYWKNDIYVLESQLTNMSLNESQSTNIDSKNGSSSRRNNNECVVCYNIMNNRITLVPCGHSL